MLILPIKKKWFDMILSGEKKEEYREITPYYTSRLSNLFCVWTKNAEYHSENMRNFLQSEYAKKNITEEIMFRNGYNKNSPSFIAKCTLSVGEGKEEWGAESGKEYYRLHIKETRCFDGKG